RPLGCNQVPELIEIPKGIPEGIATERHITGIAELLDTLVRIPPTSVDIAEDIAAGQAAKHVGIKPHFFPAVIAGYGNTAQQIIPHLSLVVAQRVEIPAERL